MILELEISNGYWDFNIKRFPVAVALIANVLLDLLDELLIKQVFKTDHVQNLHHTARSGTILRNIQPLVIRHVFVHR